MTMHPGAWIVWAGCAGIAAMSTTNPFYLTTLILVAYVVHAACGIRGPTARSFKVFAIGGAATILLRTSLVALGPVTSGSVAFAFLEGLRLATVLVIFGTFNSVTDPFAILQLAPRRFHEPALAAALALSIAPRTIAAVGEVREAQRLRGLDATRRRTSWAALAVPVLETGMEDAMTLAESMDARGHGRGRRTRYRDERWSPTSWFVCGVAALTALWFLAWGRTGRGGTFVSTYPPAWPEVSPWLMVAALSFSLAAMVRVAGGRR